MSIWHGFLNGMGWLMAQSYALIPSAGVSIIALTVIVRLVLFPLTAKQAKSMIAMQRVQPELKKLQAKYKNDKQKMNEEVMRFYRENKINPLSGCLPLVAQLPILFGLYRVIEDVKKYVPKSSRFHSDITGSLAAVIDKKKTYKLPFLGMDLHQAAGRIHGGLGAQWPYWILVALVVVTAYLSQKQTMRNQTQANPQMQVIGKVMPVVFGFISISLPAGLVLYFFVSNLWQMGQQEIVFRTVGTATTPPKKAQKVQAENSAGQGATPIPPPVPGDGKPTREPSTIKALFKQPERGGSGSTPVAGPATGEVRAPGTRSGRPAAAKTNGGRAAEDRPPATRDTGAGAQRRRNTRKRKR